MKTTQPSSGTEPGNTGQPNGVVPSGRPSHAEDVVPSIGTTPVRGSVTDDAPVRRPSRTNASRQKIFEASMQLIGERGAATVTVDEIAAEAGVSKGTVYYNFGSKDDLVAQLLRHGVTILLNRIKQAPVVEEPIASTRALISVALEFLDDYPSFGQLWMNESWKPDSTWRHVMAELRAALLAVIGACLDAIAQRYPVRSELSRSGLEAAIFGACFIVGLDRNAFHPERSREEGVDSIMTFITGYLDRT